MIQVRVIGNTTHYIVDGQLIIEPLPESVMMLISDAKPSEAPNDAQRQAYEDRICMDCG